MRASTPLSSVFPSLPETRGQNFLLGPDIVASLLRLRDAEFNQERWKFWCNWLDTQEMPQKLPDPPDRVVSYPFTDEERKPSAEELFHQANQWNWEAFDSIVIAGEGEPTLRLRTLLDLTSMIKGKSPSMKLRLTTNGLVSEKDSERIFGSGIDAVSVALMTSDPLQYKDLMNPVFEEQSPDDQPHRIVCSFVRFATENNIQVELTAVDRPDVDKRMLEAMARELATTEVRWRSYHP